MALRYRDSQQYDGRFRRLVRVMAPLLGGAFAAMLVALILSAAVVLGMQEQEILANAGATATATLTAEPTTMPTRVAPVASRTPWPTSSAQPASPTDLLVSNTLQPSRTPEPTASPRPSATTAAKPKASSCVPPSNWRL
ncbi:MAG: hypothetical protein M8467_06320, partial [Anaerolineae bacterium]|nr:hypothetical protein [Anaerolineae bacterium]